MTSPTFSKRIGSEVVAPRTIGTYAVIIITTQYCNPKSLRKLIASALGFYGNEVKAFSLFALDSWVMADSRECLI